MLAHLINRSRRLLAGAALVSVVHGLCGVYLVAQINAALNADAAARGSMALAFALTAIALMLSQALSSVLFERLSQSAQAELRSHISGQVIAGDYRELEAVGPARIQSALAEHSAKVAEFFVSMPAILTNAIMVAGCLFYMAYLSFSVFLAAVVLIGLGSLGYHYAHLRAIRHLDAAAKEQDLLFGYFRSLTDGAKELKLNRDKRRAFADDVIGRSIETVRRERTTGMSIFVASASWGNFLIYGFIGLVLFLLVADVPDQTRVMTGFALIFVYIITPLEVLLLNIPRANMAKVAAARIDEITRAVTVSEPAAARPSPERFRSLALQGVTHRYYHEQSDDFFLLGPVDLEFAAGEVVFLVGGNGSGKTSLAKLLVGLYPPEEGRVLLNGNEVAAANRDDYRQLFSAIFSDFHLFDRLLESGRADLDAEGNRLLARLHLQHKVKVKGGAFTTTALSQGQRKRLALVATYLEDRPFLVFDEWAADQDPVFKEVFYREVLPELRSMGKTVLVISHDDRYFGAVDRLIKMESGAVVYDGPPQGASVHAPQQAAVCS